MICAGGIKGWFAFDVCFYCGFIRDSKMSDKWYNRLVIVVVDLGLSSKKRF